MPAGLLPLSERRTSSSSSVTLEALTDEELFGSMTGPSSIGVGSVSTTIIVTTGLSPIGVDSVDNPPRITSGHSHIGVESSSRTPNTLGSTGLAPIGIGSVESSGSLFEPHPTVNSEIDISIELSGVMDAIFPRPIPPVNFEGLPNPTEAPTVTKSTLANGKLLPGTYRYSYAAWKGSPIKATAPSPTVDITLTIENSVSVTVVPTVGADGYLIYREDL